MKKLILFIFGLLFFLTNTNLSFKKNSFKNSFSDSTAIYKDSIQLLDGQTYHLKSDSYLNALDSTSIYGFSSRSFSNKPFIIRSYERHESEFELLSNYAFDNLLSQLFYPSDVISGEYNYIFYNYERIHRTLKTSPFSNSDINTYNNWRKKIGDDPDNFWWLNLENRGLKEEEVDLLVKTFGGGKSNIIGQQSWPLEFFHSLMKEKIARETIYDYILSSFNNVEKKIPISNKTSLLKIVKDLITFLEVDINSIKMDSRNPNWPEIIIPNGKKLNFYESFLVRRIYFDKIPVAELKIFLKSLQNTIQLSLKSKGFLNLFMTKINNDLTISDVNFFELQVSSTHSTKKLTFKHDNDIFVKCLKDNNEFYYQFERRYYGETTFLGLYNSKLEVIREPK
jgi:hypothetical protein